MHSMDIVCYLPENQDFGADKNTHEYDKLCYPHCSVHGTEYNPSLSLR